ncbi:hypothetical protein HFN60_30070 [Rhizobium leguminosarum]|uniref:hypothetical protein n=1 Tax=Rhizobium leguminosarum TaxID=384 RepID=UPI001C9544B5|nr:hypothetical protein [Rhizobium leguminosarum]MBY5819842.1 hypothetical protein [Rhizobium leguminosarum]
MSQEDYAIRYPGLMPKDNGSERAWISRRPRWDELDTPANRKALADVQLHQEIEAAYRMSQNISSKELVALYKQGPGAKHRIDTGAEFSVEYDKMGEVTHVKLDFGDGVEWRSRRGFAEDAVIERQRAAAAKEALAVATQREQGRKDQVLAAAFSPFLEKLKEARKSENEEIYDFLLQVEKASESIDVSLPKSEGQSSPQEVRHVNVLQNLYISRDGEQTFHTLKDHPAALRGHPDDTGVSASTTRLAAIRDVLRGEPTAVVGNETAAVGGWYGSATYSLSNDQQHLNKSVISTEWDESLEQHIYQPYDTAFDATTLKEVYTDQQGVEWKGIDALSDGFQPDPDQAALRLEVVERLREGDIDSLNFEEEGVSFHLDGDMLVETWINPDQAFSWDADKCDIPLYATEVQQGVEVQRQVAQEAPYELTEQDHLDMAEAQSLSQAEQELTEHQERGRLEPDHHAAVGTRQARDAYEQDRERAVQEQIQENLDAGVMEDTDLRADYDRQTLEHENALVSEAAYELQHIEKIEVLSDGRDREVFELYREAEYQHSEWMAGEREEAVDLSVAPEGVTEREWARAASDYKEWEEEQEVNRQVFTVDEVAKMDQADLELEELRQQEQIVSEVSHLRTPDGKNFVEHLRDRQAEGHDATAFNGREYQLDGDDIVSRSQSNGEEARAPAQLVEEEITAKAEEAQTFAEEMKPAQAKVVSAVETANQAELLNAQKTNDNEAVMSTEQPQRTRANSLADMADRAVARLEKTGQQLSKDAQAMIASHEMDETQTQSQGQAHRV